ncbi:MAG: hypothetical protein TEF_03720 [Rhizobiales bacterium NRL2]|jgi:integrase|nr:MAG: hypothetical protein TEF_03720 [Rhizobiales bacterium NRL2]
MPKRNLNAAVVKRLKPPASGQEDNFDKGYPGLALRISYGGRKTWVFFYRLHDKQRRMKLGSWPAMSVAEARQAWRDARNEVEVGKDPAAEKLEARRREPDTVERVGEQFIEKWHRPRNRTADEVARMLERHVYPVIGHREIGDIGRRDILDVLDKAEARGLSVGVNRVLANVRRLFAWAVERGLIETSPVTGVKPPAKEQARDRVLTDDELRAFLVACDKAGPPFGAVFRLLLLTGQRRDEVVSAAWSEFDLREKLWRLPGERTKNGKPHDVPLSQAAVELIAELESKDHSTLLFPAWFVRDDQSEEKERPVSGFGRAKNRVDAAMLAELQRMAERRGDDPAKIALMPWRIHDLRRTAASGMARLGVGIHVVEKLLNHTSGTFGGIVAVYQRHDFADEKRAAVEAWADFIVTLSGKSTDELASQAAD